MKIRRLTLSKLYGKYAEWPYINLLIVLNTALDYFRSHPACSAKFVTLTFLLFGKYDSVVEVSELDLSIFLNENTVRFYISVDDVFSVEVNEGLQRLV